MWLLYRYEPPWFCLSFLFIPLHLCAATNRLLSFCCDDTSSAFWLNLINILLGALIKYSHWCQNSCLPSSTGLCSFFLTEKRAHGVQLGYCALLLRACTVAETTVGIWCFSRKSLEWFHLEEVAANRAAWGGQAASGQHLQWLQIIFQVSFYRGRYCVAGLQNNLYFSFLISDSVASFSGVSLEMLLDCLLCFLNRALCMCPHARCESKTTWKCISVHCSHCSICLYHLCLASLLHYHFYPWGSCNLYLLIIFLHPNMLKEERLKTQRKVLKCNEWKELLCMSRT